jgi:hypothetical protein
VGLFDVLEYVEAGERECEPSRSIPCVGEPLGEALAETVPLITTRNPRAEAAVDGVGPAVATTLLESVWRAAGSADAYRRALSVVARLPTDDAFLSLLVRLNQKYVPDAVRMAARRFPRRAARLLAEAALEDSEQGRIAAELLSTTDTP